MTLEEQVDRRIALADQVGMRPTRWIATAAVAANVGEQLVGLPVAIGQPRSEGGLQLVLEAA